MTIAGDVSVSLDFFVVVSEGAFVDVHYSVAGGVVSEWVSECAGDYDVEAVVACCVVAVPVAGEHCLDVCFSE